MIKNKVNMELLEEKLFGNSYQVAYRCADGIVRRIKVNVEEGGETISALEISRNDGDILSERVEFMCGEPVRLREIYVPEVGSPARNDRDVDFSEALMQRYAQEFKPLFQENPKLKRYLNDELHDFRKYLRRIK